MSVTEQSLAARATPARAPYVSPQITSSASFERYALACTGGNGDRRNPRDVDCREGIKTGRSNGCLACTNGS